MIHSRISMVPVLIPVHSLVDMDGERVDVAISQRCCACRSQEGKHSVRRAFLIRMFSKIDDRKNRMQTKTEMCPSRERCTGLARTCWNSFFGSRQKTRLVCLSGCHDRVYAFYAQLCVLYVVVSLESFQQPLESRAQKNPTNSDRRLQKGHTNHDHHSLIFFPTSVPETVPLPPRATVAEKPRRCITL
jgi:hypothetical protein